MLRLSLFHRKANVCRNTRFRQVGDDGRSCYRSAPLCYFQLVGEERIDHQKKKMLFSAEIRTREITHCLSFSFTRLANGATECIYNKPKGMFHVSARRSCIITELYVRRRNHDILSFHILGHVAYFF